MKLKQCPNCNQTIPHGVKVCPECGKPLKPSAKQPDTQPSSPSERPELPKPKMSRRAVPIFVMFLIILIAAILIIVIAAVNVLRRDSPHGRTGQTGLVTEQPFFGESDQTNSLPADEITYLDSELIKDLFGDNILVVRLEYRNQSDAISRFMKNYHANAYQNGVSCMETVADTSEEAANVMNDVQPGASAVVKVAFIVDPEEPVQLTVGNYRGTEIVLDMTIPPAATDLAG